MIMKSGKNAFCKSYVAFAKKMISLSPNFKGKKYAKSGSKKYLIFEKWQDFENYNGRINKKWGNLDIILSVCQINAFLRTTWKK